MADDRILEHLQQLLAKLSPKQRQFVSHYLNCQDAAFGNATKAAAAAGYAAGKRGSNQLAVQGHRNLANPDVQHCLEVFLELAGCTLERDARVLSDAMNATRHRFVVAAGQLVGTPEEPDHAIRLRAVELKHRLLRTGQRQRAVNSTAPTCATSSDYSNESIRATDAMAEENADPALAQLLNMDCADRAAFREAGEIERQLVELERQPVNGDEQPPSQNEP